MFRFVPDFFFNEIDPKWGKSRVEINQDETDKRSFFATKKTLPLQDADSMKKGQNSGFKIKIS